MDPATHSDSCGSTVAAHISKSQNHVASGTLSTTTATVEVDAPTETSPLAESAMVTTQTLPQSTPSMDSNVATSSIPPAATTDATSGGGKPDDGLNSAVVSSPSSSPSLPQAAEAEKTGDLPANTIIEEAETDSKELAHQPADPRPETESERSANVNTNNNSAIAVDANSASILGDDDDLITSPHGDNGIVERSPGGRYVRFMEKLGSGATKEVYRAYDTQEGIEVAWNVVHLAGVPRNERNRIVNEVQLLERLQHHNIVGFHGSWVNRQKQLVNFVTEILSSGTLKSFITKVQVIRWKIAKRWAVQILKGLEYLHSQDPPVIHRDLKCENIFINGTSGDLRIGDLGLSTVNRNGKQLSVLGTPEFMAPDMYEEKPYDEKVDVYAFGMCMLEIFTKEIPYRECSNPAQIYKKVSRGDPPESLKRIQSTHAREFIELCLGRLDENGKYIRPSASELLAHPFLQKRPSDDDEVEVYATVQEQSIAETSAASSPANDDGSDRFEEMPDSEVNIRNVKVMVGRGIELKEEEDHSAKNSPEKEEPKKHYLVAAAVIEDDSNIRPYEDDILKLLVTLPVEGMTQHVQFDFHLVQDDAIEVAREMIAELGIPQGAVLEISETISRLARAARVSQDKYLARQKAQGQTAVAQGPSTQPSHVNQAQGYANGAAPQVSNQPASQQSDQVPVPSAPVHQQQPPPPATTTTQAPPSTQQIVPAASHPGSIDGNVASSSPQAPHSAQDGLASIPQNVSDTPVGAPPNHQVNGMHEPPSMEKLDISSEGDNINEEVAAELRKLDEEYEKIVSRSRNVFDRRMDNMARLQHKREAQHQKTLSEHEKQRADFEKRLQQEEIEQNRRIEQLKEEYARKREKMKLAQSDMAGPSDPSTSNHGAADQVPLPSIAEDQR